MKKMGLKLNIKSKLRARGTSTSLRFDNEDTEVVGGFCLFRINHQFKKSSQEKHKYSKEMQESEQYNNGISFEILEKQ